MMTEMSSSEPTIHSYTAPEQGESKPRRKHRVKKTNSTDPRWSPAARAKRAATMAKTIAAKRVGKPKPAKVKTKAAKRKARQAKAAAAANAMLAANTSTIPLADLPPMDRPTPAKATGAGTRGTYRKQADGGDHATALVLIQLALDLLRK